MGATHTVATSKNDSPGGARPPRRPCEAPSRWFRMSQASPGPHGVQLRNALASLAQAIEAKDPYTMGHSARVRQQAEAMARHLGLGEAEVSEIGMAAALHDVGKIGVPDELLRRTGPLSPEERQRILKHTVIGERILAPLLTGHPVGLAVARWHHERVDGAGYPDGLRGEEIPLAARIVAVADAYDAMISRRPYRAPLGSGAALRELMRCSNRQFDARCVAALLWVIRHSRRAVWPMRRTGRQERVVCASGRSPNGTPSLPRPVRPGAAREPRAPPQDAQRGGLAQALGLPVRAGSDRPASGCRQGKAVLGGNDPSWGFRLNIIS